MNDTNGAVQATLQKIFVLAAGMPADTQVAASLAQQIAASGSWEPARALVDAYLSAQASAIGAQALLKQMALQGLDYQLSDADAVALAAQIASGSLGWGQLVLNVVNNTGGAPGEALANKAEAAQAFTDALAAQAKGGLYFGGPQLMDGVRELLRGVTAQDATIAEAQDSLQALVDQLGSGGIAVTVADGYLSGATVFVDADGDGRLDAGEQVLQADEAGNVTVGAGAAGAGLVAVGGVDLLTGCDFEGVLTAPPGATVLNPLTTLIDALMRKGAVASAQAGSSFVEQEFGLPASLNLLNDDPLAVLANPLSTAAEKAVALDAQALALQVINVIAIGGLQLSAVGGVDAQQAARLMSDALAQAMAGGGQLDLGDPATVQAIIQGALQSLTGVAPTAQQAQDAGRIAQIVAALNDQAQDAPSIYELAKVACVSQCDAVDAVRDALAAGQGLPAVVDQYTGQNLVNAILLTPVTGEIAPGVPVTEAVLPIQTVGIRWVADDRGTASTSDDIVVPQGGLSSDATPLITGTVSAPLNPGEMVAVYGGPDGQDVLGAAVVSGLGWTFTPGHPLSGEHLFVARVVNFWGEGPASSGYAVTFNLPPEITSNGGGASATVSLAEGATAVTTVTATDANGDSLSYSIAGGADAALFTIDAATGALGFLSAPDFEAPADAGSDNGYDVVVQVSDGSLVDTQAIRVDVTNVNEHPVIASNGGGASAAVSVAENSTAVTTVTASDVDGDVVGYSIVGGADAARFTIDAATGALNFVSAPDFENPLGAGTTNVYEVVVQASDGTLSDTQQLLVTVTNVNEAPVITSNGGGASAAISVAENGSAVTTVTATDQDGNALAYSIAGGADAARFTIDASTGALSFVTAPDHEAPTDAGGNNVYDVIVQASDGTLHDTQAIAVTVTNVNEAPVITSNGGGNCASVTVAENTGAVTTVAASDVDGNIVTYSIAGGADSALFTIDAGTGALAFVSAPDFENPADAGANNVYNVTVRASDGTLDDTQAIAVTVTNQNEAPVITSNGGGATAAVSVAENSTAVTTVAGTDQDGNALTYSILGGADSAKFTINASTGALSFITAPDFENPTDAGLDNVYNVVVQASDGTLSDTQSIAVTVTNQNEAPVITSNGGGACASVTVGENTTAVATVAATDVDGNAIAYSIAGGADSALFTIDASTGALSFISAPDFENPQDSGADNGYQVTVQASDGTLADTQMLFVTVSNLNESPVITSNGGGASASVSVAEGTAAVTTVTATDQDGNTLSYSIAGGADSALFTIDGSTGALSFITAPDFENPADAGANNVYNVTVRASDGTLDDTQAIAVTVTNQNEAPVITSNGGGSTAGVSVAENSTTVTTVTATDVDGNSLSFSIVGGSDSALFTIDAGTGVLSFITAPDFEAPVGSGSDNSYDVTVRVSDGTLDDTQAIYITVTDVNEAPVITSDGGGASATASVAEGGATVTVVDATDVDGDTVSYSIAGGADSALFTIDASTGALSFITAPDYENPGDAGADNVYNVTVRASDGTLDDTQAIAVTVTNENEAPEITSNGGGATAGVSVAENSSAVTTVTATDVDGNSLSYSIAGGMDSWLFTIDASTGALSFITAPDYESPGGSSPDNVYEVTVQVSDGTLTDTQAITVTVTDQNEAPEITSGGGGATGGFGVAENTTAVTTVTATDVDGDSVSYSISGGADSALFTIDATTGALSFVSAPDYENPLDTGADNLYQVVVRASDGTLDDTQALTITVTGVNEVPVITSNGGGASASVYVEENTSAVTTVGATDVDGDGIAYSLVGGGDSGLFTIDASTGALSFITAPDYENPLDTDGDNVYYVHVLASDGTLDDMQAITVTVSDANEAPVITSNGGGASASVNVEENTSAVTTVGATDVDGDTLGYSIAGGADAAFFTIDGSTGALSFITAPDFGTPLDSGSDNLYEVTVQVSDGTLTDTQDLRVTVTDKNDAPEITSNGGGTTAGVTVAENTTAVTTVTATDVDGDTPVYAIVGGTDSSRFTIDASTGALRFITAPDFENPQGGGSTNVYEVTVGASDGTLADTQTITVTVVNANDAPVITSNGGGASASVSVAENTTAVTTVTAIDQDGNGLTYSIVAGSDMGRFTIDASTGALSFITAPDFENPQDIGFDNAYNVAVLVSDGTLQDIQALTVTVTNANEAPVITSNGGGGSAAITVAENTTAVTTVTATDVDAGATLSYSIAGGADSAKFTIDGSTGVLSFVTAPDFELPGDAGANNVYEVTVRVSDGTLEDTQALAVTVSNQNEAPAITSNGGGATAGVAVMENTTAVTTVTATDVDGNGLSYSIAGGADSALFTINASTGALSFLAAPDRENPADAGADNVYDVTVRVSDGTLDDTQALAVTVTNQNEAPVITSNGGGTSATVTLNENTTAVTTVAATDVDGNSLSYSIVGGADSAKFTINSSTGALAFVTAPNYEVPTDAGGNNVYDVTVRASDGTLSDDQSIAVTVSNVAEAPSVLGDMVFYSGASAASTAFLPRIALFNNDSGETAKSGWSLTNVTNTPTGGTASLSGSDLSLSGFDTATTDTFTYQATDAGGTSGTATVTVQRVATANVTGSDGADVILGSNSAGALVGKMGNDYILGGTGNDTITGGMDADDLTGGAGADTFVFNEGTDGVGPTAVNFSAGTASQVDNGDTFTFANGVDVIRGFVSGTDKLDLDKNTAPTSLNGVSITTKLGNNDNYTLVGNYNEVTRVFTANTGGSDLMLIQGGNQAPNAFVSSENDFIILIGVTSITGGGGGDIV